MAAPLLTSMVGCLLSGLTMNCTINEKLNAPRPIPATIIPLIMGILYGKYFPATTKVKQNDIPSVTPNPVANNMIKTYGFVVIAHINIHSETPTTPITNGLYIYIYIYTDVDRSGAQV